MSWAAPFVFVRRVRNQSGCLSHHRKVLFDEVTIFVIIRRTMGSSYSGQNTAGMMDSHLLVVLPASVLLKRASGRV